MKTLLFLSIMFHCLKCYSQIEQVDVKTVVNTPQIMTIKYDSTDYVKKDDHDGDLNFIAQSKVHASYLTDLNIELMQRYIGQEVLILPKSHKYLHNNEFSFYDYANGHYHGSLIYDEDFYEVLKPITKIYKPVRAKCIYDSKNVPQTLVGHEDNFCDHVSDYNSLAAKKFRISEIAEGYYKLKNEENGDVIYYSCYGGEEHRHDIYNIHPPLLVIGNFEKLKNSYLNKDFIYINKDIKTSKIIDNNSGQSIEKMSNSEWKCTKIALADYADNPYQKITFILNNSSGNQIAVELYAFKKTFIDKAQYLQEIENKRIKEQARIEEQEKIAKEKADEEKREKLVVLKESEKIKNKRIVDDEIKQKRKEDFIKKYGDKYGSLIANGKVKIGMTKEMCIAAWSNPIEKLKQNSVLEKWAYKSKSLYFDKTGIVTAIQ